MLHHDFMPNLHYVLQHDYGDQTRAVGTQNAEWYSIVNYLTYDIDPKWSTGLRAEWFHDDDGTRFLSTPAVITKLVLEQIGNRWVGLRYDPKSVTIGLTALSRLMSRPRRINC